MAAAKGSCMRMLGFVMIAAIIFSIFSVSYESEFWSFWGGEKAATRDSFSAGGRPHESPADAPATTGFAHAIPLGKAPDENEGVANVESVADAHNDMSPDETWKSSEGEVEDDSTIVEDTELDKPTRPDEVRKENIEEKPGDASNQDSDEKQFGERVKKAAGNLEEKTIPQKRKEVPQFVEKKTPRKVEDKPSQDAGHEESETTEQNENGSGTSEQKEESVQKDSGSASRDGAYDTGSGYGYVSERKSRAKSFLVVFMGHSGSTAFTTELRTHSEFEVELLEPLEHGEYQGNTELALKRAHELMDRGIAKGKIPGFKIRPFHLQNRPEAWQEFAKHYDSRVIWQYRENIVKQAIGEYRHRFLNDSSVVEGLSLKQKPCEKGSDQQCRIKIENMRGLHGLMNDFSGSDELLAAAVRSLHRDDDMMIVRYEDYLYTREKTMREAFDFLGVDYQDTAPQRFKASPDSLCEMVSNFQDVCNHFQPCQLWRPFLHDSVNDCKCRPGGWKTFDSTYCKRDAWYQGKD